MSSSYHENMSEIFWLFKKKNKQTLHTYTWLVQGISTNDQESPTITEWRFTLSCWKVSIWQESVSAMILIL